MKEQMNKLVSSKNSSKNVPTNSNARNENSMKRIKYTHKLLSNITLVVRINHQNSHTGSGTHIKKN